MHLRIVLTIALLFSAVTVLSTSMTPVSALSCPIVTTPGAWCDEFNSTTLDTARWSVGTANPAFWGRGPIVKGGFASSNVSVANGYLTLKSTVTRSKTNVYTGTGAEIFTKSGFRYGYYEARVRTASISSNPTIAGISKKGFLSTFFNYVNNSETEIDHEIQSGASTIDWTGAFKNFDGTFPAWSCDPATQTPVATGAYAHTVCNSSTPGNIDLSQDFHLLAWNWTPSKLTFLIDNQEVFAIIESSRIPVTAAPLYFNFWLSNGNNFSNLPEVASRSTLTQYYLIDYVRFSPSI
jgi:endo-1,3-1,4-beta-glycanase ExoK